MTDSGWRFGERTLRVGGFEAACLRVSRDHRTRTTAFSVLVRPIELRGDTTEMPEADADTLAKAAADDALRRFCRDVLAALGDA